MRILHVIGSLSPADGGPPEGVRQLARAYSKIGVDIEVLCQDPPDAPFLASLTFPVHALGQRWLGRFGLSPRLPGSHSVNERLNQEDPHRKSDESKVKECLSG